MAEPDRWRDDRPARPAPRPRKRSDLLERFELDPASARGWPTGWVSGDLAEAPRVTAAALAYVPATLVLGAVGAALVGWLPRAAAAVWSGLAFCFVVGWLGEVLGLPQWVRALSPYTHVDLVPAEPMAWRPALWMLTIAVGLVTLGVTKLSKRDIG